MLSCGWEASGLDGGFLGSDHEFCARILYTWRTGGNALRPARQLLAGNGFRSHSITLKSFVSLSKGAAVTKMKLVQLFRRRVSTKKSEHPMNSTHEITNLLHAWSKGNSEALEQLIPLVDYELKMRARNYMRKERPNHLLKPTGLVNELWMKLLKEKRVDWESRTHFYAFVARRMRQVLHDYWKKEPKGEHFELTGAPLPPEKSREIVKVHEMLDDLAKINKRAAMIVELRYFGGYTVEEVATIVGIGTATVERESRFARSWLWREMTRNANQ